MDKMNTKQVSVTVTEINKYLAKLEGKLKKRPFEWSADGTGRAIANIIREAQKSEGK